MTILKRTGLAALILGILLGGLSIWGAAGTRLEMGAADAPSGRVWSLALAHPYLKWRTRDGTRAGYSMAATKRGTLRYAIQHGVADLETGAPLTADTRFRIASMTKPITAVAAMILVERGTIALDDPIADYIPAFADIQVSDNGELVPPRRAPALRDLLSFTAGIGSPNGTGRPDLDPVWAEALQPLTHSASLEARVNAMAALPLYNHPGEAWHYASSLTVMARVIEIANGQPFEVFLEAEIFGPLGMADTGFMPPPGERDSFATLYTHDAEGQLMVRADPAYHPQGRVSGDGRLVSTLPDYLRFALMLSNGGTYQEQRILSEASIAEMTTPHATEGVLAEYDIEGLGWGLGLAIVLDAKATPMPDKTGDFFWSGVNGTHFWISPKDETVFVYMTQYRAPSGQTGRPRGAEIPFVVQALVNGAL